MFNAHSLVGLIKYVKKLLDTDHLLFSLDETSFGIDDLKRYGWGKIGEKIKTTYQTMKALKLVCCISPTRIVSYQFVRGGSNCEIFRDYLQSVYQSSLFNFENKKVAIIIDNLPAHKSNHVKKIV